MIAHSPSVRSRRAHAGSGPAAPVIGRTGYGWLRAGLPALTAARR